jgi:hypothetical protein
LVDLGSLFSRHFDEERERRVAAIHRDLMAKMTAMRTEPGGGGCVAEVPLKSTSDLLVLIS